MDEYDIDGVYLDGTAHPWHCGNRWHGCGYEGADGKWRKTYGIFAAREMMRRIYAIVKSRKPRGQVNVHNSTMMVIPSLGWATSTWDGEQFGSMDPGPHFEEVLPLDAFRAEFMGQQWGVPAEFLCYNRPYTYEQALAFTLLHDVLVRSSNMAIAGRLWRVMDEFGRKESRWLPYWENGSFVTTSPKGVHASVYSRGAQGAMIVVSNLGRKQVAATVQLQLRALSLAQTRLEAVDAMKDETIPLLGNRLELSLGPMGWRTIRVLPKK